MLFLRQSEAAVTRALVQSGSEAGDSAPDHTMRNLPWHRLPNHQQVLFHCHCESDLPSVAPYTIVCLGTLPLAAVFSIALTTSQIDKGFVHLRRALFSTKPGSGMQLIWKGIANVCVFPCSHSRKLINQCMASGMH